MEETNNKPGWPSGFGTNKTDEPGESLACTVRAILQSENIPVQDQDYSVAKDLNKTISLMEKVLFNSDFTIQANFPSALK